MAERKNDVAIIVVKHQLTCHDNKMMMMIMAMGIKKNKSNTTPQYITHLSNKDPITMLSIYYINY